MGQTPCVLGEIPIAMQLVSKQFTLVDSTGSATFRGITGFKSDIPFAAHVRYTPYSVSINTHFTWSCDGLRHGTRSTLARRERAQRAGEGRWGVTQAPPAVGLPEIHSCYYQLA